MAQPSVASRERHAVRDPMSTRRRIEVATGLLVYVASVASHLVLEFNEVAIEYLPVQVVGALVLGLAVGRWLIVLVPLAAAPSLFFATDVSSSEFSLALGFFIFVVMLQLLPTALGVAVRKQALD